MSTMNLAESQRTTVALGEILLQQSCILYLYNIILVIAFFVAVFSLSQSAISFSNTLKGPQVVKCTATKNTNNYL